MNREVKNEKNPMQPSLWRTLVVIVLLLAVGVAVFFRMRSMILTNGEDYAVTAESKSTKSLTVYGMRGTVYDKNMVPLAYDRISYNIAFYRDPSKSSAEYRAKYTQTILDTIDLVESMGKSTIAEFWLKQDEKGNWYFDTGSGNEAVEAKRRSQWAANFYLTNYPEKDWYKLLLEKYAVPTDLDQEKIVKVLAIWQASRMSAYTSSAMTTGWDV